MLRKKSWSAEHIAVLAAHLRAAEISEVLLYSSSRESAVFENTLSAGDVLVRGNGFSVRNLQRDGSMLGLNVVVARRVTPNQAKSLVSACFDSNRPPKNVTLCVVPRDLGMTRDEVVAQCISSGKHYGGRADVLGLSSEGLWVTFFARAPSVFLVYGPSRSGKSSIADLLNSYGLERVSGDSVLELIGKGYIVVSPRLREACERGIASDNWGHSLSLINKDDDLREEFANLLASRRLDTHLIDLWMPTELKESVVAALTFRGFKVFSVRNEINLTALPKSRESTESPVVHLH